MIAYELALRLPQAESNAYMLHQSIWQQLLAHRNIDYSRSLLYRTVEENGDHFALLRLPSELRDDLDANLPVVLASCPISEVGQRFLFSVRLCPLYRSAGRYERTPTDFMGWASELFLRNGFEVAAMNVSAHERGCYAKPGMPQIPHNTSLFSALVKIVDIDLAQRAWLYGIGRRKSTGCGMLVEA